VKKKEQTSDSKGENMKYDLIIIGMGISGISAAIYAKNSGLNALMLEKEMPGGLTNKINKITNYPGYKEISGPDLSYQLFATINELNIPYKIEEVKDISVKDNIKIIKTEKNTYESEYLIIATGRKNRHLGLDNEEKLLGHGISTCALCDASLYKDKEIAIVGGGNSAIEEALYLSNIVKKIYLIHRRDHFTADDILVNNLKSKDNIEYFFNSEITKLNVGNDKLESIEINNNQNLVIAGLFTYLGFEPNIDFIKNLNITDESGYIKVNEKYETNINGIYAVGDCIKKDVYQLITGANDGAVAAIEINKNF
jgi:thioredoxin reductase (NADPH)